MVFFCGKWLWFYVHFIIIISYLGPKSFQFIFFQIAVIACVFYSKHSCMNLVLIKWMHTMQCNNYVSIFFIGPYIQLGFISLLSRIQLISNHQKASLRCLTQLNTDFQLIPVSSLPCRPVNWSIFVYDNYRL